MKLIAVVSILAALTVAFEDDYQEEINKKDLYCEHVKQGVWPSYNESINCGE